MDKYFRIENLINEQRKKNQKILEILELILGFLPKVEIQFSGEKSKNSGVIKIKIKDKSSVRFVVLQNKEKIIQEFKKHFSEIILLN